MTGDARQRGTVLVLCITLVTLLGLLGMSALQAAIQQQRMAGNQLLAMQAFESAERLLLLGEARLSGANACGFCLPPSDVEQVVAAGPGSSGVDWWSSGAGLYAVQHLGVSTSAARMPVDLPVTLFRVTAIGLERQARVVLESVYALPSPTSEVPPRRIAWRQVF